MNERTHVDLFTGLAGFSLAARANGVRTISMCEADERCQAFLSKAWPGVPVWPDVRTFNLGVTLEAGRSAGQPSATPAGYRSAVEPNVGERMANSGRIGSGQDEQGRRPGERAVDRGIDSSGMDNSNLRRRRQDEAIRAGRPPVAIPTENVWLLTAGVPCQPASRAGKQGGASDDRWLWPAALSVFASVRPAWAIFENPPGIGDVGLAGILSDLGREGYAVRVFSVGACALGAPHRRMRYWIVCKRGVGQADSTEAGQQGHGRRGMESGATGRQDANGSTGTLPEIMANTPERGQREHGSAPGDSGHADECGQNSGLANPETTAGFCVQNRKEHGAFAPNGRCDANAWGNYVWLPCADGKVRRAPDDSFSLVNGLHRSVLGALGNSIVWPVAAQVIKAMIESEPHHPEGENK